MILHFISRMRPCYEGDGGGGSGAGGNQGGDPAEGFKRLLEKNGSDALRVAELLHRENFTEREQSRTLRTELEQLRGRLPAEGTVVLTAEQSALWQAYSQLGDVPTLQTALSERETARTELVTLKRTQLLGDVAEIGDGVTKYKPTVLAQLAGDLVMEIRAAADGKKSVIVKDGDKETPLADYAKVKWADFLPALQATPPRPAIGSPQDRTQRQPPPAAQTNAPKRSIL